LVVLGLKPNAAWLNDARTWGSCELEKN
jgi:hypothetical protein